MSAKLREHLRFSVPKTPDERRRGLNFLRNEQMYLTPDFGIVSHLAQRNDLLHYAIVYPEPGRGMLMRLCEATRRYTDSFAVMFVGSVATPAWSQRRLQIGENAYWLEYTSNCWSSRLGTWEGKVMKYSHGYGSINLPTYSIDFVRHEGRMHAVDFDTNPGLKGTDIGKVISPKECRRLIRKAMDKFEGNYL